MRDERAAEVEEGGGRALWATGVEEVDGFEDIYEDERDNIVARTIVQCFEGC